MGRRSFFAFACVMTVLIFIAVNVLSALALKGARIDLTENQLYGLSDGAKQTLDGIGEPIDVTFYFSRHLAQDFSTIRAYGARVRELLEAYASRADGKLRLQIIDPEPFSEEEDRAIAAGLEGAPTQGGEVLYFGLTAQNALDERATIGFFSPEREAFLEYEITRLIAELEAPARRKVALVTALPLETPGAAVGGATAPQGLYLFEQLRTLFDITVVDREFVALPEDAELLLIAHPWELSGTQLYAIDQFVLRNGRAVVVVDPYSQLSLKPGPTGLPAMDAVTSSDLGPLLAAWGVDYDPRVVVLDRERALRAAVREDGRLIERAYPLWIALTPEDANQDDLITAPFQRGVNLAASGVLAPLEGAGTAFVPLLRTSADAALIDSDEAGGAPSPSDLLADYTPAGTQIVAARVSGVFSTAYPDGPPQDEDAPQADVSGDDPVLVGAAQIVVIADADLFDDTFYVRNDPLFGPSEAADNANVILSALDVLAGADALVTLRSRARSDRPMTRVERLRADAEARLYEEEARLEADLSAAEARLMELSAQGASGGYFTPEISREEEAALATIREEVSTARARLRDVQREFRRDIDSLFGWLVVLNVWLMPIVVLIVGVVVAARRRAGHARGRT